MNRPWMPLHIADYLKDTTKLRASESGAYLHLIMDYWQHGKLPDNDRQLASIAKMTDAEWRRVKPILVGYFGPNWSSHKRIDKELQRVGEITGKRRSAAMQRHSTINANGGANDMQTGVQKGSK